MMEWKIYIISKNRNITAKTSQFHQINLFS
jgi:hypothetical protein